MNNHIQVTLKSSTIEMNLNSPEESIYLVPELEGLTTLPEIRTSSGVNAGADGGWTSAQLFDARLISMRLVIANEDIAVVESKRRLLNTLLAQGRNEELALNITTEAGNAYTVNVRVTSVSASLDRVLHRQDFLIQFRADDPLIYGSTEGGGVEAILNVQKALGGFAIPFTFPLAIGGGSDGTVVQNVGTETVYPIITLYGNLHSPTVINRTTNQQLQIIADLASDIIWGQSQTAQGEYIQITNELSLEAPLASVEMLGKAEQDGTPTPDSPVDVQVVTGENVLSITGKNLCPDTSEGYWVGSAGTNAGRTANDSGVAIPVRPNTYYAVSTTTTQARYRCAWADATTTVGGASLTTALFFSADNTSGSHTGSSGSHKYLIINATDLSAIQLELGSTASDYEAYQAQEFEVNLGKNLLPIIDGTATIRGITATVADGVLTLNGTSTGSGIFKLTNGIEGAESLAPSETWLTEKFPITNLNGANIAIDYQSGTSPQASSAFRIYGSTSTYINQWYPLTSDQATTWASDTQAPSCLCFFFGNGITFSDYKITLQIEKGTSATPFVSYFTPIELAKIGNYQDRIYKADSKWYIEKKVGKVVFDGSETYTFPSTQPSSYVRINTTAKHFGADPTGNTLDPSLFKCNNFVGSDIVSARNETFIASTIYATYFCFPNNIATDVATFKTWLASNPTTVYYALATPTTTEITNEALIAQLDALGASSLYVGVNNIGTETQNAMPTLKIEYHTSYEKQTDVVVIDSQANTITMNGLDIYNLMAEGSEFIEIAPGDNIMLLTSTQTSDDGYAEVKYKQGYLSI